MGIRGVFANSLKKALNAVIPNKLWPKIKKRLRFALSQRGRLFFLHFLVTVKSLLAIV